MSFWTKELVKKFEEIGRGTIRVSCLERDRTAEFDQRIWTNLANEGLFSVGRTSSRVDLQLVASAYYGLAKGSLDIPLVCSFAAHGVIARDLLKNFGTEAQILKYLQPIEHGDQRAAICNSESGAGTDLRKIASVCNVLNETDAVFSFHKPCVTNGFNSSINFISSWEQIGDEKKVAVYIVDDPSVKTVNLAPTLNSFRTGITGSVSADLKNFKYNQQKLRGNAFHIFRHCFHLERLFIGVIVAGAVEGLEEEARKIIAMKALHDPSFAQHQWIQDKLIRIVRVRTQLTSLIEQVLTSRASTLESHSQVLSILKIFVNEEAPDAARAFFELVGHQAILNDHIAQKLVRDFAAFSFFGGTTELQKITLAGELLADLHFEKPKRKGA